MELFVLHCPTVMYLLCYCDVEFPGKCWEEWERGEQLHVDTGAADQAHSSSDNTDQHTAGRHATTVSTDITLFYLFIGPICYFSVAQCIHMDVRW